MNDENITQENMGISFFHFQTALFYINKNSTLAKNEFTILKNLIEEKKSQQSFAHQNLTSYADQLPILFDLMALFPRIEPYCEFVDEALLAQINTSLKKINSTIKNGFKSCNSQLLQSYAQSLSEEAAYFENTKSELIKLIGYIYDKLEWFILFYKQADWKSKEDFFSTVARTPQILAAVQPWIDIAEEQQLNWETAMAKSICSLSDPTIQKIEKRIYQ
ncbi:MAG: hypothetical protein SFW07_07610 [Gammaproteobacteria bacterium]|nr:hypothetical protein [Gammaproteobacteria bacterium]